MKKILILILLLLLPMIAFGYQFNSVQVKSNFPNNPNFSTKILYKDGTINQSMPGDNRYDLGDAKINPVDYVVTVLDIPSDYTYTLDDGCVGVVENEETKICNIVYSKIVQPSMIPTGSAPITITEISPQADLDQTRIRLMEEIISLLQQLIQMLLNRNV